MKWFKHYSNANSSMKLQMLLSDLGVEGYGQYWLLLELLCDKFDGESSTIDLFFDEISAKVRIKFTKKLETFLQKLSDFHLISYQISGKIYKIDAPILFDLQAKDFKFATKKRQESDTETTLRIKNKNKIKEEEKTKEKKIEMSFLKIDETANFGDSYEFVRQEFNKLVSGKGNVKPENGFFMPPRLTEKFTEILQIEHFRKRENWTKYFSMISESEFLLGISDKKSSFKVTIDWVIDPNNAGKVLSGKYSNNQTRGEIEVEESFKNLRAKYGEDA